MSIVSVDNIQPIGSGTSVTVNSAATLVLNNVNSTGVVTATSFVGNLTGNPTGTLQTAAQPNITSVGTLSGLTVAGNVNCTSGRFQRGSATIQDGDAIAGGININGLDMDASVIMSVFGNDGDFTRISGSKSRNASVGSHTIVQDNDVLLSLKGFGSDGTNFEEAAQIEMQVDGTPNNNVMPGRIVFKTATTDGVAERLRITSTGQIRIGGSISGSPQCDLDVVRANSTLTDVMLIKGNTGNGFIRFQDNDNSCNFTLGADDGAGLGANSFILYDRVNSAYRFGVDNSGNFKVHSGNIQIGTSGKGIDFSATANGSGTMENELLNDYEEGTWVPVYNNVNTPNYGHRSGRYTKIGRFVYLVCQISVDSGLDTSDGSTVNIGGFPFAGNSAHGSCLFTLGQYIDVMPDSTIDLFTNVRFNSNSVMLHEGRNNQDITYTQLNSSGNLQFACSYAL